jgi:aspartate-semialdehyde dehydrogenase
VKNLNLYQKIFNMSYKVAIIGATGAVGNKLLSTLIERNFPLKELYLLASNRSEGKQLKFKNRKYIVQSIEKFDFEDVDIAFFSAGSSVSAKYAEEAEKKNCYVIDNTSYFRMDKNIPLVVPEVNHSELDKMSGKIISNPNCSTIQMLVALKPIHNINRIKKIIVSTYQSVSGAGQLAMNELGSQSKAIIEEKALSIESFPKQIAFNVIPQIDLFMDNRYTKEEMKMVNETKKILDQSIDVNATCVRVPSYISHAESVYIELENDMNLTSLENALNNGEGVIYSSSDYHTPLDSTGQDAVYVSRLRRDLKKENAFNLWIVSDNLLKGAALNSVQIGEALIKKKMV